MREVILILERQLFRLIENQVVSKFWADSNEMEEDASDNGEETVHTKRKPGRPPKGTGKSRKTAKAVLSTTSQ